MKRSKKMIRISQKQHSNTKLTNTKNNRHNTIINNNNNKNYTQQKYHHTATQTSTHKDHNNHAKNIPT